MSQNERDRLANHQRRKQNKVIVIMVLTLIVTVGGYMALQTYATRPAIPVMSER